MQKVFKDGSHRLRPFDWVFDDHVDQLENAVRVKWWRAGKQLVQNTSQSPGEILKHNKILQHTFQNNLL